jgi:SAM-dependent methyltransferase
MLLNLKQRQKVDNGNDLDFYSVPRFVNHVDERFINRLTNLFLDRLSPDMHVFDMMSSWASYLPDEMTFDRVIGHGLNEQELAKNPRLDRYFIQNLNQDIQLPLVDESFDAVLNTSSVQYLQYPEAIFAEIYRILKPNGIAIFSFSNRMLEYKAIAAWRHKNEIDRVKLVKSYFQYISGFSSPEAIVHTERTSSLLGWINVANRDPFYAVIARKIA